MHLTTALDTSDDPTEHERDGLAGLRRCVVRELCEEFGHVELDQPALLGLVVDPTSEVGRRHLGFVFEAHVPDRGLRIDRRYDNREYSGIPGWRRFSSIDRLLGVTDQRFDPWSRLVLGAYRSVRRR